MSMVFPASLGERCPRADCGSPEVEPLDTHAGFRSPSLDLPVRTLWLCQKCQRPFKLVSAVRAREAAGPGRTRVTR